MKHETATANQSESPEAPARGELPILTIRGIFGGVLMGLANLVPGISGGTMLLAVGIYPRFIRAIAEVTSFRWALPSLVVLGSVGLAAVISILLLAGTVKNLVVEQRWVMYSLFIGLTLGGLPVVWRMARPIRPSVWAGAGGGFVCMTLLSLAQARGAQGGGSDADVFMMGIAGLAGASAMILPGVSGGYLLLVLGVYVPILAGIDRFKEALRLGDLGLAIDPAMTVLLPVGIGVVAGVVAVSHLLKWLLERFEKATLGFLVGLLVGAVVGLWPFQKTVPPVVGETVIKGQVVTAESLSSIAAEDYPTAFFDPTMGQILGALGLVLAGIALTAMIARFGQSRSSSS